MKNVVLAQRAGNPRRRPAAPIAAEVGTRPTMPIKPTRLPGVLMIEPRVCRDDHRRFLETWSRSGCATAGLDVDFVQDNLSASRGGALRGLPCQHPRAQRKLVAVLLGEIVDVAADVRLGSPTFGAWAGFTRSDVDHRQLYVPPGFAHGFQVTSDVALVACRRTAPYHPEDENSVAWDDPAIGIAWPSSSPILSGEDADAPRLGSVPGDRLPRDEGGTAG